MRERVEECGGTITIESAPRKGTTVVVSLPRQPPGPSSQGSALGVVFGKDVDDLAPLVSWGITPEQTLPVTGRVPSPADGADAEARAEIATALDYMALAPGTPLQEIAVDRVFIGSCTNGRIEDLRAAAAVARRGSTLVPAMVVPGSGAVKRQAEAEGLDRIFRDAGFEWRDPGCSLCTAINGDVLAPGERCASTTNRNFRGRQGPGGRTHLMGPAMAAACALRGRIADVRSLAEGG